MRLIFAFTLCFVGMTVSGLADNTNDSEKTVVGNLEISDKTLADGLSTALAQGLCRYNNGRIICPYKEKEVILTINEKNVR